MLKQGEKKNIYIYGELITIGGQKAQRFLPGPHL